MCGTYKHGNVYNINTLTILKPRTLLKLKSKQIPVNGYSSRHIYKYALHIYKVCHPSTN
jgi:hypothetical protein